MVVQPRPLATRHDLVGVGARQVNDVGRVGTEHPAQRIELVRRDRDRVLIAAEMLPVLTAEHQRTCVVISHPHGAGSGAPEDAFRGSTQNIVCYVGRMDRFLVPAAASIVVGLLLGAAAIFGVTLMVQQDSKPALQPGDPASSVLNRVEYGDRT
jgi:Protein of unknown function (DUF2613)